MSENPYESPQPEAESSEATLSPEEAAALRAPCLTHEVIVRTTSVLFFLKAAITLSLIPYWVNLFNQYGSALALGSSSLHLSIANWVGLSILSGVTGWGLWKFRRWAWIISLILLVVGMLNSRHAIWMIVFYSGILCPLLLRKTVGLFSESYRLTLRHSPKMKYGRKRVAAVVWAFIALFMTSGIIMEIFRLSAR